MHLIILVVINNEKEEIKDDSQRCSKKRETLFPRVENLSLVDGPTFFGWEESGLLLLILLSMASQITGSRNYRTPYIASCETIHAKRFSGGED